MTDLHQVFTGNQQLQPTPEYDASGEQERGPLKLSYETSDARKHRPEERVRDQSAQEITPYPLLASGDRQRAAHPRAVQIPGYAERKRSDDRICHVDISLVAMTSEHKDVVSMLSPDHTGRNIPVAASVKKTTL